MQVTQIKSISFQDFQSLISSILNITGEFTFIDVDYFSFSNPDYYVGYSSNGNWTVKNSIGGVGKASYLIDAYEQVS
jgi:hypothetical protein